MQAAKLPEMLKPSIGGEGTSICTHRVCRGDWGERALQRKTKQSGRPGGMLGCSTFNGDSFLVDACVKRLGRAREGQRTTKQLGQGNHNLFWVPSGVGAARSSYEAG